jgi:tRNA(Ile)-lysidine synthase
LRPLLSYHKQRIYHYLNENKIDYAIDITNQLPIYQRNIVRQELNNSSKEEKKSLEKEIKKKNRELRKIKGLVKIAAKQLITSPSVLKLDKTNKYSPEIHLRLLYF